MKNAAQHYEEGAVLGTLDYFKLILYTNGRNWGKLR